MKPPSTLPGPDGRLRCSWCLATPEYLHYHDTEWGFPVTDDRRLFEAMGMVNDHAHCALRPEVEEARQLP